MLDKLIKAENKKAYMRRYNERNKDKKKEYNKEYWDQNKDKIKEQQEEYRENNIKKGENTEKSIIRVIRIK